MTLEKALTILADYHTRDDESVGFIVHMSASHSDAPWWSSSDYIDAWRTVRMHLHRNVNPTPEPAE